MSNGLLNLLRHLADARASRIRETERKRFQRHIKRPFALDIERLEERNSIADALGPALTTSALSIMGQMMELVAPQPLPLAQAVPGAGTTVAAAGITDSSVLQVVLPERPEGPKNVSGGIDPGPSPSTPTSFQQPAEAFGNPWQGKPLYADFAQNTLLIDLNAASKQNSSSNVGAGADNLAGGSGGGGGGSPGQSSAGGGSSSGGSTADGGTSAADVNHGGGGGGGPLSPSSPSASPAANSGSAQIASSPTTSTNSTTAASFASPTSGVDGAASSSPLAPSSSSPISPSGVVSPTGGISPKKKKDALWVLDANNALVITPGVTEHDFSNYTVDLRAQVTGGTVTSYSWDFTNAPDATSISGSSTYRTQFT